MPRIGMEPIRRDALVKATISCIKDAGSLDVTVGQIAKRAGMSTALAHHYFGGKSEIFHAAMRHILREFGDEVRRRLTRAHTPRARLEAIIGACFSAPNFQPDTIAAWLNFYVQAQTNPQALRLLRVYHGRMRSNLIHELRSLCDAPAKVADGIAALIDGLYVRASLRGGDPEGLVLGYLDSQITDP